MALFESTWDTASGLNALSVPQNKHQGKKRKREDGAAAQQNINLDKLIAKMAGVEAAAGGQRKRDDKKEKTKGGARKEGVEVKRKNKVEHTKRPKQDDQKPEMNNRLDKKRDKRGPSRLADDSNDKPGAKSRPKPPPAAGPSTPSKLRHEKQQSELETAPSSKKQKKRERKDEDAKIVQQPSSEAPSQPTNGVLTALQSSMKNNLEGARFRFINEQLYKSSSNDAQDLMRKEPQVYTEYHTGFRHQTKSWPINPVTLISSTLSSLPPRSLIVDLGCGDAQLAKTLVPTGLNVLSFDLVSDGAWVVEADICTKIPLPGSEKDGEEGQAVVDACVCSLSLMSTNWVGCVREAWRVLRMGGKFTVAEVTSRFQNTDQFVEVLSDVGFELVEQTAPSTHFLLFNFRKVERSGKEMGDEWEAIQEKAQTLLKACEYKRR